MSVGLIALFGLGGFSILGLAGQPKSLGIRLCVLCGLRYTI